MTDQATHKIYGIGAHRLASLLRSLPYLVFGFATFTMISRIELNPILSAYLILLEVQTGIALIFFIQKKLSKRVN
ncbi:hypothetical protein TUMEXPCC7403_19325 [Tumidithrix helvetica PCC 7403]|uniref:hypothetical protein n=1 Tax=Tumidithrix helvetica TaxID=3457545 RepID=UPI003CBD711D